MNDAPPGSGARWGVSGETPSVPGVPWRRSYPMSRLALTRRAARDVRKERTREAPPKPATRMAETRVHRGPRLALQPRPNRSGAQSPTGRQAIDRPVPRSGLQSSVCVRIDACEVSMVSDEPRASGNSSVVGTIASCARWWEGRERAIANTPYKEYPYITFKAAPRANATDEETDLALRDRGDDGAGGLPAAPARLGRAHP